MKIKIPSKSPTSDDEKELKTAEAPPSLLFSPSEIYHENSKLHQTEKGIYSWIYFINTSQRIRNAITRPSNSYRGNPRIELPDKFVNTSNCFEDIIVGRRSVREFSGASMSLSALAKILYVGDAVVKSWKTSDDVTWPLRTAPSAGGLYPIDIHCVSFRVNDLKPGLYFYNPVNHNLEQVANQDYTQTILTSAYGLEETIGKTCVCLIMSAVMPRVKFKYGERAYRFALLETGHIAQNLLLSAYAEGLGACPIGGFLDDPLNDLLGFDGVQEIVLYLVLIGCLQ
jgi:SagB-type dehydrogenase family enzyme